MHSQVSMQQQQSNCSGMVAAQASMQQQQMMQQQQQQQPGMPQQPGMGRRVPPPGPPREREMIWKGELEWQEKVKEGPGDQKITHSVACSVSTSKEGGVPE